MQIEDLAYDLPLAVDLQQGEHVCESVTGPVVELEPYRSDCVNDVDAGNLRLEFGCWPILIIPVKELLNWSREQVGTDIAEDCRVGMKGSLHISAAA